MVRSVAKLLDQFVALVESSGDFPTDEQWQDLCDIDVALYAACKLAEIGVPCAPPKSINLSIDGRKDQQLSQLGCTGLYYLPTLSGLRIFASAEWWQVIRQLRAVVGKSPKPPGKRGPNVVYDPKRDEKMANDWTSARAKGSSKAEFCKNRGISERDLNRLLTRIRKRRAH